MKSYKQCKTAAELNQLFREERITRHGYVNDPCLRNGNFSSTGNGLTSNFTFTKQNTFREGLDTLDLAELPYTQNQKDIERHIKIANGEEI
jgi:hypothetical protein